MAKIPFNIKYRPQIETGEYKVETGDKKRVRIICWNRKVDDFPIVALAYDAQKDAEIFINASVLGEPHTNIASDRLFLVTPEEELSEFEYRIFKLLRQYKECDIPLTPENIKAEASMLWSDFEKYFFDLYGKDGEGDSALRSFYHRGFEDGEAEALRTRATELTKDLAKSGLDKDSIPYHLIEFMCNLYTCQNWKEIEETAEAYVTRIKAAAMKGLPRWKKDKSFETEGTFMGVKGREYFIVKDGYSISVAELIKKLPGFKE